MLTVLRGASTELRLISPISLSVYALAYERAVDIRACVIAA